MELAYSTEEKRLGILVFRDAEENQVGLAWSHGQEDWSLCGADECIPISGQLAAAAPDLLAALENLVERGLIKDKDNDHYDEVLEAIAKAKGEKQ